MVDTIGEGGFAKVYLVVDDKEKMVAVKVLHLRICMIM